MTEPLCVCELLMLCRCYSMQTPRDEAAEQYMYAAKLATITSSRAMCQAFASGLGGYLGHVYDRSVVTAVGCFIWGTTTLLFSFTTSVGWGAFAWAWNGVGLSFIIPNSQSLVADYYSDSERGKAFGTLYTTGDDLLTHVSYLHAC